MTSYFSCEAGTPNLKGHFAPLLRWKLGGTASLFLMTLLLNPLPPPPAPISPSLPPPPPPPPSPLFPNALHTPHTYPLPGDLAVRMKCQFNLAVDCSKGNGGRGKDKPPPPCVTLWFYCRNRASSVSERVMLLDIWNMSISGVPFAVFRGIKGNIFNPSKERLG